MSYVAGFLEKGLAERRGRRMFLGGYPDYVQMMVRKGELQCGKKGVRSFARFEIISKLNEMKKGKRKWNISWK